MRKYASIVQCKTAGGLFMGHSSYMLKFIYKFQEILHDLLSKRIILYEEGIFGIMIHMYPELIEKSYGWYSHLIENYGKIRVPAWIIFMNIKDRYRVGDLTGTYQVCKKLYDDCFDKLNGEQLFDLFDNIIVATYHIKRNECESYAKHYISSIRGSSIEKNSDLLKKFMADKDRQRKNLSFICSKDLIERLDDFLWNSETYIY